MTINLDAFIDTYDVSTTVTSPDGEVVCERAMYWNGRQGGHDSVGVTAAAPLWYLAEGATAGEFETWVLVQNPGDAAVHVEFHPQYRHGRDQAPRAAGGGGSGEVRRRSFNLDRYVDTYDVSTTVTSPDGEVVCERAMYWNERQGGHDSVGVTAAAPLWYLAEGATAGEFETWVLVQNPGDAGGARRFHPQHRHGREQAPRAAGGGGGGSVRRRSFNLDRYVDTYDVSTTGASPDGEVVCERAMYWNGRQGGHDSVGVTAAAPLWYLAEGATTPAAGTGGRRAAGQGNRGRRQKR